MTGQRLVDRPLLEREAPIVHAGAAASPTDSAAAEQGRRHRRGRRGVADAHLAETKQIDAARHRRRAGTRPRRP